MVVEHYCADVAAFFELHARGAIFFLSPQSAYACREAHRGGDGSTWGHSCGRLKIRTRLARLLSRSRVMRSVLPSPWCLRSHDLFTIAGMVPFIPYIMGVESAPWPRATSVQQKCIFVPTTLTTWVRRFATVRSFQMNGKSSFGDYFKEGAINFAWDLLTFA